MTTLTKPQIRALIEIHAGRADLAPIKEITLAVLIREGLLTSDAEPLGLTHLGFITARKLDARYDIDFDGAVTTKETS